MQPHPLDRYPLPAYPTRLQIEEDPELLRRHLPPAWRRSAQLAGAATVFLAVNTAGCGKTAGPGTEEPTAGPPGTPGGAAAVAPIFAHGEGRGATGCVVIAPPVFLSEEEALQVIVEELQKAGVQLSERNVTLPGVRIAPRHRRDWDSAEIIEETAQARELELDGRDPEHRVGVEFVSGEDHLPLGGVGFPPNGGSSVTDYDVHEVAGRVAHAVTQQGEGLYFGAFYDPMEKVSYDTELTPEEQAEQERTGENPRWRLAAERSRELLRQQVQDFVEWLEGQGVI